MNNFSLEDIARIGEKFYLDSLKTSLEITDMGKYVVIDVEEKKHVVDTDRLTALEKAKTEFGDKIFYVTQIGMLQQPTVNYLAKKHAWNF
jgi:hypothetical protein